MAPIAQKEVGRPKTGETGLMIGTISHRRRTMVVGQDRCVEQVIVSVPLDPSLSPKALATYSGISVRKLREYLTISAIRCPIIAWVGRFWSVDPSLTPG